uniref:Uncharacterized protein n=1 Tax=Jaculus jaculus TaxID=51337 RepID=A0A8C5KEU9_JACJA
HNRSAHHSSNSHSYKPSNNPSKTSGLFWKKRIVKQKFHNGEQTKEWHEREQRQKEANKMVVTSFPKDLDYRRKVMQATGMEDKHASDASSLLPQNILHNDKDHKLPRAETHSSSTTVQHPIKPALPPAAPASTLPSSLHPLLSDYQPEKSPHANGASAFSKRPSPISAVPAQKTERKQPVSGHKTVSHSCTTPSTSSASGLNPTSAPPASASTVSVPQLPIPTLLQDPNLLRQLLP